MRGTPREIASEWSNADRSPVRSRSAGTRTSLASSQAANGVVSTPDCSSAARGVVLVVNTWRSRSGPSREPNGQYQGAGVLGARALAIARCVPASSFSTPRRRTTPPLARWRRASSPLEPAKVTEASTRPRSIRGQELRGPCRWRNRASWARPLPGSPTRWRFLPVLASASAHSRCWTKAVDTPSSWTSESPGCRLRIRWG